VTRRVFINRSLATAGGMVILSQASAWPAWAGEAELEGINTRMGRLAFDRDTGKLWQSHVRINIEVRETETSWGKTRYSEADDAVMVASKGDAGWEEPREISGGLPDAILEPRMDARGGAVQVAWCACRPETGQWRVFSAGNGGRASFGDPQPVTGDARHALHPDVALDEEGTAWIVYEDWSDGSVRLTHNRSGAWTRPVRVSESGRNYRPRIIVTDAKGRHGGKLAVVWDSYRDFQYDVYMRLIGRGGEPGEEMRVTRCPRWDSMADVAEDLDGNLWVAWVRASNELSEFNGMRNVHVRFFDGERWMFPNDPEDHFKGSEFIQPAILGYQGMNSSREVLRTMKGVGKEVGDGRITWYSVCWFPEIGLDHRNRVYVFYRESDPIIFPLYSHLDYRVYQGDRWSGPKRIKLGRGANIARMMWGLSVAVTDKEIESIWEEAYVGSPRTITHARKVRLKDQAGPRFSPSGNVHEETVRPGWKRRETMEPRPEMEIDGEKHRLVFGDTHAHSWTSDGADPADYYYHFARDFARLDFFGLSDHDFRISNTPGLEAYISFLPKVFSEPDFVCFQGYEFTSSAKGHRCVIFEGDDRPTFPSRVYLKHKGDRVNTVGSLNRFLRKFGTSPGSRVVVTSHNMFDLGNDFSEYDEALEPLYDVMSQHVSAEKTLEEYISAGVIDKGGAGAASLLMSLSKIGSGDLGKRKPENKWFTCWRQCLDDALPLGAYGNSDTHAVSGVGWITGGLWVRELSRKAVFDAMFKRRSIAIDNLVRNFDVFDTSPFNEDRVKDRPVMRMDIRFWLDGHFMGQRPRIESAPVARARVEAQDPDDRVRRIVFVKNGKEAHAAAGFGKGVAKAEWKDNGWSGLRSYYYVRVEFESGYEGYSSPVFANF